MVKSVCDNCALRLYNTKSYNIQGIGNPFYGNCIVVPNVDYKAYKGKSMDFSTQVEVIRNILIPFTGGEESNFYIVPLIRCNEQISCEVDNITYNNCLHLFANDIRKYDFKNILLLGTAARRFLNCNITEYLDTIMISPNGRKYFVNYSPLVKYSDEKLFKTFKEKLIHWYKCINNGIFNYNFITI